MDQSVLEAQARGQAEIPSHTLLCDTGVFICWLIFFFSTALKLELISTLVWHLVFIPEYLLQVLDKHPHKSWFILDL